MNRLGCALIAAILGIATQSMAAPILTATCEEPSGPRIDLIREATSAAAKLKQSEDRSTGVHPIFILDSDSPKILTYVWGPTKKYGDPAKLFGEMFAPQAQQAAIVIQTEHMISAVAVRRRGVNVFTLLPKLGFMTSSLHAYTPDSLVGGDWFETTTFMAMCRVSK